MLSLPKDYLIWLPVTARELTLLTILVPGPISRVSLVVVSRRGRAKLSSAVVLAAAKVKASD